MISHIDELEQIFAREGYESDSLAPFVITQGSIPVLLSAPHAVNHFRNGEIKYADIYTGGIATFLQEETACHLICAANSKTYDPNFDQFGQNPYQQALLPYIKEHAIRLVLDLHGASYSREYAVEIGTGLRKADAHSKGTASLDERKALTQEDPNLGEYHFLDEVTQLLLTRRLEEAGCEKTAVWKNRVFAASGETRIAKVVANRCHIPAMQLEINRLFRDKDHPEEMKVLTGALKELILLFGRLEWDKGPDVAKCSAEMRLKELLGEQINL